MKTKNRIKVSALKLFNEQGFKNITLREVAVDLDISYGNVTYHFHTKQDLIQALYEDMHDALSALSKQWDPSQWFLSILEAPRFTFSLTKKYLFFYIDFVEIKRSFPKLFERIEQQQQRRKQLYLGILQQLQKEGILRSDLCDEDLNYLMDISGAVRTFYIMNLTPEQWAAPTVERAYVQHVNRLLFTYLTDKGMEAYRCWTRS